MYFKYKKQTETLLYLHHTLTKDILRSRRGGRFIEQEKRIIFQRGLLDWSLPIWTLPSVSEIRDKM